MHIFLVANIGWLVEDKSARLGVSNGGVNTGLGKKGSTSANVGHGSVGVHILENLSVGPM